MSMASRLLEVTDLNVEYSSRAGPVKALESVSLAVGRAETIGIVGESGSGKSSLGLSIMKLLPPNIHAFSGVVRLEGSDLTRLSENEFRRTVRWKKISMVFQGAMNSMNPVIRVGTQIAEPLFFDSSLSRHDAERVAKRNLRAVGLSDEVFRRYPHELSGGMKQRAAIAMALVTNPKLVLLDEPTSALDVSVQAQIMNLLKKLRTEMGLSILFISHDLALASELSEKIAVMYAGQIVEFGTNSDVLTHPLHPYTQLLLASAPRLTGGLSPGFIPGIPPDLVKPPAGCRFHPRCPYVFERCKNEDPLELVPDPGHSVRCWLHGEKE